MARGSVNKEKRQSSAVSVKDYAALVSPVMTEKTSSLGNGDRKTVVFRVHEDLTKPEIKEAVSKVFGVQVDSVRTINVLGKVKRTSRSEGRRASFKKAYVTLKEGQSIDIVEGV